MTHPLSQEQFARACDAIEYRRFDGIAISPKAAIAIAACLWPRFVEYRGCYFIQDKFDAVNVDKFLADSESDKVAVERALNHVHLWDIFDGGDGEEDSDMLDLLAAAMAFTWKASAQIQYPAVRFETSHSFAASDDDYGPTVYLWAVR